MLSTLAGAVNSLIAQFTSQNISNAIIAFAKLEFRPEDDVLVALAADAVSKIHTFTPQVGAARAASRRLAVGGAWAGRGVPRPGLNLPLRCIIWW